MIDVPFSITRPAARAAGPLSGTRTVGSAAASADAAAATSGDSALATQQQAFNLSQSENAELQRELNAIDDMLMAQAKDEDAILKKWIAMI